MITPPTVPIEGEPIEGQPPIASYAPVTSYLQTNVEQQQPEVTPQPAVDNPSNGNQQGNPVGPDGGQNGLDPVIASSANPDLYLPLTVESLQQGVPTTPSADNPLGSTRPEQGSPISALASAYSGQELRTNAEGATIIVPTGAQVPGFGMFLSYIDTYCIS